MLGSWIPRRRRTVDGLRSHALCLAARPREADVRVAPPIPAPLRYGMWPSQLLMDAFGSPLPLFFLVTMLVTVSRYRLRWQRELEFGSSGGNGESPGDHTHTVSATPLLLCHTHYTQASRPAAQKLSVTACVTSRGQLATRFRQTVRL